MKNYKNIWTKAKRLIPSGNSFLSKNPSRFPVKNWPIYFSKAKGCYVWDLKNKKYIDYSFMGVGTNVLGYANDKIDQKVIRALRKSNMSTLNCVEEVELAGKLIKLHPWADQAKFARTGAEANSLAIRIARAYTKKNRVIVCGYHGWHDWYLSANLKKSNILDTHLFNDLRISGVPKYLKNQTLSFNYNNIDRLKKLLKNKKNDIACLIMEVERDNKPHKNFLSEIRKICTQKKVILIFDECTTGFRENYGGRHLKYKIYPDIAMFGKALGNGYAITSIIGKRKFFKKFDDTFASSTFWSERSGYVAAIATLDEMKRIKSWHKINQNSNHLKNGLKKIFEKHNFKLKFSSIDSLIGLEVENVNKEFLNKFILKEMLKNGYLSGLKIYVSIKHDKRQNIRFLNTIDKVLKKFKKIYNEKKWNNS